MSVSVTVGGTATLTATSATGTAAWSVSVPPAASYITGTSVSVSVSASKIGFTAPSDVGRTLAVDLVAPTAPGYTAPDSLKVGVAMTSLSPAGGTGIDEYSATGLPSGLSINTTSGVISGTPDTANASTAEATVTVADNAGNTATASITFPLVAKGDQTLTGFQYSVSSVTFGSAAPTVTAPTGGVGTLGYTASPETVCTVNATTGALTLVGVGECEVTATAASTDHYNEGTASYTVTVAAAGQLVLNVSAIAGDNTVNIAEKADGFSISGDTGSEAGVSVSVTVGGTATLTATSATGTAAWSVSVPPAASYITGTSVSVSVSASKIGFTALSDVGRTVAVDLVAPTAPGYTAPDSLKVGVAMTSLSPTGGTGIDEYSATGLPSGLSINTTSGVISGTPDTANASTAEATVTVADNAGNTATASITFPLVAKGDQTLTGFQYSVSSVTFGSAAPTVTAPTGGVGTLGYTASPETVCTVNATTGALTLVGVGECEVTATAASTDHYNEGTASYTVTVAAAGQLVLNVSAIAGDNTVNIAEKADGFSISGDTGSEAGVSVSVTVGGTATLTATSATGTAAWSVSVPPAASYITGTSVSVSVSASKIGFTAPSDVGRTVAVDLVAPTAPGYTAPDSLKVGVAMTSLSPTGGTGIDEYSATGLPSGLSINTTSGVISGTPDTANASTAEATVTVADNAGNTATASITFPLVAKGDQTLTGFQYSVSSVTFGSAAPTVTAPTGAVTTVGYTATPTTVCTVNATTGALTIVEVGECEVTATAASSDDYNEATATYTVTVSAAGQLVLNVAAIAGDGTVNVAEKAAGFAISGDTGSEAGVSVSVAVGSTTLTATSADESGTANWSVSVPPEAAYITGTSVAVSVTASKTGFTAPSAVTRTLTVDLAAPTAPGYTAPGSLQVGEAMTPISPSGGSGIDEYRATELPSGLSIDESSGAISGTPDTANASTAEATVTVADSAGNTATVGITFPLVAKGDQTLSGFSYSVSSVGFGSAAPTVTAPSGAVTTVGYTATPTTVCTVNATTGALTIVGVGDCQITATAAASDDYNEATATYTVTVAAAGTLVLNVDAIAGDNTVNIAEKAAGFTISGDTGSEGGVSVTVTVGSTDLTATSSDADQATWTVSVPGDATYITGTSVDVNVSASKTGYTASAAVERTLTVDLSGPTAPSYTAPTTLAVGTAITAMSPSGGSGIDEYSATGLPSGLSIDSGTGAIGGTPDTADAKMATAAVTVSDTADNTATVDIVFPAVAKGDQTLTGFQYSVSSVTFGSAAPTVTAPSGVQTTVIYSAAPATVCTVNPSTGALTLVGVGTCEITATAADTDDYNEATTRYTVTVAPVGTLVLNVDAIAGDNTVNIAEKAAGFTISGDTGSEGGVSVTVTVGSTDLTATSSDADQATWTVSVPGDATYITGTSVAVAVNASKTGYTVLAAVERTLAVDLAAPTVAVTSPAAPISEAAAFTVAFTFSEPVSGFALEDVTVTNGALADLQEQSPNDGTVWNATGTVSAGATGTVTVAVAAGAVADGASNPNVAGQQGFQINAPPVFTSAAAFTVQANQTAVGTVLAEDRDDADPVSYAIIGGADQAQFELDATTGALSFKTAPDFEAPADVASTEPANAAGNNEYVVRVTATGGAGTRSLTAQQTILVTVTDVAIEPVTLTVTPTALTVLEGESATYEVVLDSQPESDMTVDTSSDSTDVTVVPSSLTFTSSNWSTAQTVTLSAADDSDVEDDAVVQVTHTVRGGDYGSETASPVTVTVPGFEEDAAGTTMLKVPTAGERVVSVPEGTSMPELAGIEVTLPSGTDTVTIRLVGENHEALTDPPQGFHAGNAVVDIESDPPLAAGQTAVVCLPASGAGQHVHRWDDEADPPAWVELEAPAGGSPPGLACGVTDHFSIFALGSAPRGMTARVMLTVSPERVAEDATGVVQTVTATLNGRVRVIDTEVMVSVSGDTATVGDDFAAISDFALTIPAGATSGTGTFTLAPVDDAVDEPDETVTVSGEASGLVVLPATVTITDNDEASMILALALDPASVPEGGGAAQVTVTATLGAAAGEPVAVTLTLADGTAAAEADFAPVRPVTLTIPAGSSGAAVTVTVTPVDDAVDEGAGETVTVAGSAAGFAVTPATLTLADDDEAPVAGRWSPSTVLGLATAVVPVGPAPLTAWFVGEPSEHDGETPFTVGLTFSEEVAGLSPASLRDTVLEVTGGRVTAARLLAAIDNRRWELTVEPAGYADVSIALAPTVDCAAAGAVCTADGRKLSSRLSTRVRGPAVLSVADARVRESADATLDFAVRLSRARDAETRVDWGTGDGTARAGADYRAASGTLVFAAGETSRTVAVAVLVDAHDEGDETLTLTLSNPVGARLGDAEATGTIGNTGAMPRAWLARFGRTVADQVLQAAADRLEAVRAPGTEVTLAGQRIGGAAAADAEAREAEARLAALTGWLRDEGGEDAGDPARGWRSRAVTGRDLLTGSSFALTGGSAADGFASLWGRGAVSIFDGREGDLTLDGEVAGAMLGADWRVGRGTGGLMLSHARGEGDYRSPEGGGEVSTTLTGLYPYGRYAVNERVTVWGVGGYGAGTLTLEPEGHSPIEADMDLAMAAAGLRAVLVTAPDGGGVELAVKPDALLLRTTSDAVLGALAAAEAKVTRLRLGIEGTWRGLDAGGGRLAPSLELGVRHDGGNAGTGYGADIAAGLAWSDAKRGIEAKLGGRGLLTHEDGGLRERGFSASLAWDPAPGSDRGVRLTLAQTIGASASSGADALLVRSTVAGLAANADGEEPGRRRLEATLGYGFPVFADRFTWTPEIGVALSQADRSYRLGWRLGLAGHDRVSLDLGLQAMRREPVNDDAPEHGVALRLNARW